MVLLPEWPILCLFVTCILQFGSHTKKRPNNLVIGRTYDHHIYDLVEVGVENFKSMESFTYDKKTAPKVGSKPFIAFIGEGFENVEELKHFKEVLLDMLKEEVCLCSFLTLCLGSFVKDIVLTETEFLCSGCGEFKSCGDRPCICMYSCVVK